MPDTIVAVPYAEQETDYYCGPATLQMLLSAFGIATPAAPPSWQDQLWEQVKSKTGASRPPKATGQPSFPKQKCEMCSGTYSCWSTTPAVLIKILNLHQAFAKYAIKKKGTEEAATGVLMDAIDKNIPGVALVRGWQHWLIVEGYRHDAANASSVAGRNLNGVYVRDPDVPGSHYIPWDTWYDDYMWFVPCGMHRDKIVVLDGVRIPNT